MQVPTSRLSVALATYNGARYLRTQLESLAKQTRLPDELVVGDDGSTDDTVSIVQQFAREAPFPVRLHVNERRLNYADNFLQTALRCEGDFVAFCDQDDVWMPEKLERCMAALHEHDGDLCAHEALLIDADGSQIGYHSAGIPDGLYEPLALSPWEVFFGFTVVFRRDLLSLVVDTPRPPDSIDPSQPLSHDRWIYFLGSSLGRTVYLATPLASYRQHDTNAFGNGAGATFSTKLRKLLTAYPAYVAKYSALSTARRRVLEEVAARDTPRHAVQARKALAYWSRVHGLYESRVTLSRRRGLARRVVTVVRLARSGGYASYARGGLSRRALVEDVVAACIQLPNFIAR